MEIGQKLKAAREAMGLSLEEVEQATKIRRKYLQALENEQFDLLPGAVYAKAFLKNYARFLNMDVAETIEAYNRLFNREAPRETPGETIRETLKETPKEAPPERSPARAVPRRTKEPVKVRAPGKPRYLLYAAFLIVLMGLAISLFYGARGTGLLPPVDTAREDTLRDPAQTPPQTGEKNQTPGGQIQTPDEQAVPEQTGLNLVLNVKSDRSWMRVIVDGNPAFQGEVLAGQSKNFEAKDKIAVTLGNAGVVEVVLNEENLGFLGGKGAVVYREFTLPQS